MKVLRATVLACYGILTLVATAPHAHEFGPGSLPKPLDTIFCPTLADGSGAPAESSGSSRPTLCGICAFGRSLARPASGASLEEVGPSVRLPQRPPDAVSPEAPHGSAALLRAPPAI